jgi:hypothetical protein
MNRILRLRSIHGQKQRQMNIQMRLMAAGNEADEHTKAAQEVALTSEVAKATEEEYDSEATLSRGEKWRSKEEKHC